MGRLWVFPILRHPIFEVPRRIFCTISAARRVSSGTGPAVGRHALGVDLSSKQAGVFRLTRFDRFCLDLGLAFAGQCTEYIYSTQAGCQQAAGPKITR